MKKLVLTWTARQRNYGSRRYAYNGHFGACAIIRILLHQFGDVEFALLVKECAQRKD